MCHLFAVHVNRNECIHCPSNRHFRDSGCVRGTRVGKLGVTDLTRRDNVSFGGASLLLRSGENFKIQKKIFLYTCWQTLVCEECQHCIRRTWKNVPQEMCV
uniref:Uncharacterized protein n=1 Tax=Rhipicephalus microplus TaxID=6941 RepID=A0A6G5AFR7_RHIMP